MSYYRSLIKPILLLDLYPGAIAAYSFRKISSSYVGPSVRVRRSSDNLEQDINFDGNGNLNENSLIAFVGSGDGFITKWYDQSGNSVDQVRSIQNQQPQLVSSGTVYKTNNKYASYYDGSRSMRSIIDVSLTSPSGEWSSFGVIQPTEFSTSRVQLSYDGVQGNPSFPRIGQFMRTGGTANQTFQAVAFNTSVDSFMDPSLPNSSNQTILNSIRTTNSVEMFVNGVGNGSTATSGTPITGVTPLDIGYRDGVNSPTLLPIGYIQELIHYPVDATSFYSQMVSSINSYYNTY